MKLRCVLNFMVFICSWTGAQPASAVTQTRVFTPFDAGGELVVGLAVTGEVEGSCEANSAASPERPDAWRCSAENEILDPCFQNVLRDGEPLACTEDPFSADVVMLTLSTPLPDPTVTDGPDFAAGLPWALELANGQQCTLLTGATASVAGMRINYGCPDGAQVVGEVNRRLPRWRVFYQTAARSLSLEQVGVATAWY